MSIPPPAPSPLLAPLARWSFGTLLYEMMCGLPPFYDTNVQRMYTKILSSPLRFPSYLSEDARGVLTGLLKRPVSERLGSGPTRFAEISGHAFYKVLLLLLPLLLLKIIIINDKTKTNKN